MRQEWNSRSSSSIGIEGIELALDYTCNFMCRMCTPALSTSWRKYDEDWPTIDRLKNSLIIIYLDKSLVRFSTFSSKC